MTPDSLGCFQTKNSLVPRLAEVPELANIPWVSFERWKKKNGSLKCIYVRKKGMTS